ncbi:MAG: glycosyltransferase family 2 protein [Phenylobacterium sp.]
MARDAAKDNPGRATQGSVSVIVVAWQSGPDLTRCLAALAAQTVRPLEILLVDNASTDGAPEAALQAVPGVTLIAAGANLGFAAGVNLGARQARGEWLALVNPDAFAAPDWLERLLAGAARSPQVGCFGCRQAMAGEAGRLDGLGDVMSLPGIPYRGGYGLADPGPVEEGECFSACGGAMLVRRSLFEALGGFDEELFMYCEDVDLGYRIRLAGGACRVIPDAVVEHRGSASTGGAGSDFASFHGARNRIRVFIKDTPPVLFWLTLPLHVLATAVLFLRLAGQGRLAPNLRGARAALSGLPAALAARRRTQATRTATSWEIARAMTCNPLDLLGRRVVIRRPRRRSGAGSAA